MTELSGCPACTQTGRSSYLPFSSTRDHVLVLDLQPLGHLRRHEQRIVPGHLGHRLGKFLQPAVVGEAAVVDGRIAAEVDFDGVLTAELDADDGKFAGLRRNLLWLRRRAVNPALSSDLRQDISKSAPECFDFQ